MDNNYLMHYRTPGSKNGERLYQYKDGSLTPLGREHYGVGPPRGSSTFQKLSKWTAKRKAEYDEKKAAKKAVKDAKKKRNSATELNRGIAAMTDDELRVAIARTKLEQEYKSLFTKPGEKTFRRELLDAGKDVFKNVITDFVKTSATDFLKQSLGMDTQGRVSNKLSALAMEEWKKHKFDPDYAPGSVMNKYSKEYLEELNRTTKVKNQQADHSFDASKGDTNYWKRKYEESDRAATLDARARRRLVDSAERDYQIAKEKYDNAPASTKVQARKDMEAADQKLFDQRTKLNEAMDKLTPQQRRQVYSDGEKDEQNNQNDQNNQNQGKKKGNKNQ